MAESVWDIEKNVVLPEWMPEWAKSCVRESATFEENRHHLTRYYKYSFRPSSNSSGDITSNFTHAMAILFMAMTSAWKQITLELSSEESDEIQDRSNWIHAFYQIVEVNDGFCVAKAVKLNTHGLHRGDLRFLKINHSSKIFHLTGNLLPGDVIKVYRLILLNDFDLLNPPLVSNLDITNLESALFWLVHLAELMPRELEKEVKFVFVNPDSNCRLVLTDTLPDLGLILESEMNGSDVRKDKVHTGIAFTMRVFTPFAINHLNEELEIQEEIEKYFMPPTQLTTIRNIQEVDATAPKIDSFDSRILTVGRRDDRVFHLYEIEYKNSCATFIISNPPKYSTLGKWTKSSNITMYFRSEDLYINLKVDEVQELDNERIKIKAIIPKTENTEIADSMDMKNILVFQEENALSKMDSSSKAAKILRSLYGGKSSYSSLMFGSAQYRSPLDSSIKLDPDQSKYIKGVLHGSTIMLVDGAFGTGKTMIAVTAMLEFHKVKNRGKGDVQQIFVMANDYALQNCIQQISPVLSNNCKWVTFNEKNNVLDTSRQFQEDLGQCTQQIGQISSQKDRLKNVFQLFQPNVIICTVEQVKKLLFWKVFDTKTIKLIQIDDAHSMIDYKFFWLLKNFSNSSFALLGDSARVAPHDTNQFHFDNIFKIFLDLHSSPTIKLGTTYRCYFKISKVWKDLFYSSKNFDAPAISVTSKTARHWLLKKLWNSQSPIVFVHDHQISWDEITSNKKYDWTVRFILSHLTNYMDQKDIGVMAVKKSITFEVLRQDFQNITIGNMETFHGAEKDIMIICGAEKETTTNEQIQIFTGLSRAKNGVIIVGNVYEMLENNEWKRLLQYSLKKGALVSDQKFQPMNMQDFVKME